MMYTEISRVWFVLFAISAGSWLVCTILFHLTIQVIKKIRHNRRVKREQELVMAHRFDEILRRTSK